MHITLRTPTGSCPTPLTVRMCLGIMPPDMCSQRLSATTYGVSASMDAIDDVLAVSSAYCYGISRHIKDMMWRSGYWNTHCFAVPMHIFHSISDALSPMSDYYPLSAWLITHGMTRGSEASHGCTSLAHQFHYVVSANYYVAITGETTGAEDGAWHTESQPSTLSILFRYI